VLAARKSQGWIPAFVGTTSEKNQRCRDFVFTDLAVFFAADFFSNAA
jgi:hypothetical protein